jgi:hypothetical protein
VVAVFLLAQALPRYFHNLMVQWAITIPGTFLHEMAHYGYALLMDGNPETFSIFPTWDSRGVMDSLGHITFYPNWWNAWSVGLAPFMVLPAGIWLMLFGSRLNIFVNALCIWAAACSFYGCMPSDVDISGSYPYPASLLVAVPVFLVSLFIWFKLIVHELKFNLYRT